MVRRRDDRPAEFRGAVLGACPIAPIPDSAPKVRDGAGEVRDHSLAGRAFLQVLAFFDTGVADDVHGNSLFCQVVAHFVPPSLARTDWSARKRCVFTVPSAIPVT